MNETITHFEFRTFAYDFGPKRDMLHYLATLEELEEQTDIYLIVPGNHNHSIRVRNHCLNIKYLIRKSNDLEQWCPILQTPFPLTAAQLRQELFTSLNVMNPRLEYETYEPEVFWEDLIKPHPAICLAYVVKQRFLFSYGSCQAEISNIWVNGAPMQTLAMSDEDGETIERLRVKLALQDHENVSYPLALERIMNLTPQLVWANIWPLEESTVG